VCLCAVLGAFSCRQKIGGCYVFPKNDEINRPIDKDPVDYMSACVVKQVASWGNTIHLGAGYQADQPYGMPNLIAKKPPLTPITFGTDGFNYWQEASWLNSKGKIVYGRSSSSTAGAFLPFPKSAPIQGWLGKPSRDPPSNCDCDRHSLVLDESRCFLAESYFTVRTSSGFKVSGSFVFDLKKRLPQNIDGAGSADAAGLPMLPLLLRYADLKSSTVNHVLRMTTQFAQGHAFVHPATHTDGEQDNTSFPYYGARFRLKKKFSLKGYSKQAQSFLRGLKKFGVIFADQGNDGSVGIGAEVHPGFLPLIVEINNHKPLQFSRDFEMVQSPNAVIRTASHGPAVCKGKSANKKQYRPKWNPKC